MLLYYRRFSNVPTFCHQVVQVSWEQKGKSDKVPIYEAEVCFGTAGLEAPDEERLFCRVSQDPSCTLQDHPVNPVFHGLNRARIGSQFAAYTCNRWKTLKQRMVDYVQ